MNLMDLYAKISLDASNFVAGLKEAGSKMSSFASTLSSNFSNVSNVGKKALSTLSTGLTAISNVGKTAFKTVSVAATATTAAVGAFAKSAVDTGMEFDASMSQVMATMGNVDDMSEEAFGKIKDAAREMGIAFDETTTATELSAKVLRNFAQEQGATTAFSARQAADALNYMALAGYDVQTSMEMLPTVLNLAAAGSIELATASDMITDAQSALGLTLEETSIMVDQMAKAASKSNTSVAQLGEAILTVGGTASYMSGGTEELTSVLGVLADNGIKGSEAGTHLRNMLLSLSSPSKDGAALIEKLNLQIFDAEGNMRSFADIFPELNKAMEDMTDQERLDAFSTLFNSRDIASATALLNTTKDRWKELKGAILDAEGAAKAMADTQLDNLAGDITLFKSALEGAQIVLSDQLTPALRKFVQFGTDSIGRLSNAFQSGGASGLLDEIMNMLDEGIGVLVDKLPEFAEKAVEIGVTIVEKLAQSLLSRIGDLKKSAGQVRETLFEGFLSIVNEIAPVIQELVPTIIRYIVSAKASFLHAGLEILTAIVDGILENADDILDEIVVIGEIFINNLVNAISSRVGELSSVALKAADALLSGFSNIVNSLLPIVKQIIPTVVSVFLSYKSTLFSVGLDIITAVVEGFASNINQILNAGISLINNVISGIKKNLPTLISSAKLIITELGKSLAENAPMVLEAAFEILWALIDGITSSLPELIPSVISILVTVVQTLLDNLPMLMNAAGQLVLGLAKGLLAALPQLISALPALIISIVDFFVMNFPRMADTGIELLTSLVSALPTIIDGIISAIPEIISGIISTIFNAIPQIISAGVKYFTSLITNLPEIIVTLVKAVPQIIAGIVKGFGQGFAEMANVGLNLIKGLWDGIKNAASWLWDKVSGWASDLVNGIKGFFGIHSPSKEMAWIGEMLVEGLSGSIEDNGDEAVRAAKGMAEDINNVMQHLADDMSTDFTFSSNAFDTVRRGSYSGEYGSYGNGGMNFGGVTINVSVGGSTSSAEDIAEAVAEALQSMTDRRVAVYG